MKDVRDFLRTNGPGALRNCPAREWMPTAEPSQTIGGTALTTKKMLNCLHWSKAPFSFDSKYLVHSLLLQGDASVVYGPSNLGKSFFTLDLAAHVASGSPYRGNLRVDKGAVLYVTLEGRRTFANRLAALSMEKIIQPEDPLYYFSGAFNLLEDSDPDALVETIADYATRAQMPVRLIVIDTLSRAMPGGDESSSVDMGLVVQAFCKIKDSTEAHVMLVHHTGKDVSRGARGHSNLRGAADTEIEIKRDDANKLIIAQITKQRDLPLISPMAFSLQPVVLGQNNYGETVTSCIVKPEFNYAPPTPTASGTGKRRPKLDSDTVLALMPAQGTISKKILVTKIQESEKVSQRSAQAFIEELIISNVIAPVRIKSASGQNEAHVMRVPHQRLPADQGSSKS